MCNNALNSRGKPAVPPMSGAPTFDMEKNRNGANLKLRHALLAGGIKTTKPQTEKGNDKCQLKTSYIQFQKMIETPWWLPGHAAKSGDKDVILLYFQCPIFIILAKAMNLFFIENEQTIVSVVNFVQYLQVVRQK